MRVGAVAAAAAMVLAGGASCSRVSTSVMGSYCAFMPDTIGLYVGNPVTQMGYQIGTVAGIEPGLKQVRVNFSLTEQREIPADVRAVIRSPSVLADRSMELVGNYVGGATLEPSDCIPLTRTMSPKSLSEVIGSADTFVNAINTSGSTNIADTVQGIDLLAQGNGAAVANLLTAVSDLLDSPDQQISDIGSIIQNLGILTTAMTEVMDPMKQILWDAPESIRDVTKAMDGAGRMLGREGPGNFPPLIETVATLEHRLGGETQLTLDAVSATLRKVSPHANELATLFNAVPWWINNAADFLNTRNFGMFDIAYRPPVYRVATHDGQALCGMLNASTPGSCAYVNGEPYAVDVALLQYVLQEASQK